jgi:low affinity Fe/Cu permease
MSRRASGSGNRARRPRTAPGPPPAEPRGELFHRLARSTEQVSGHPAAFLVALAIVLAWAATGPLFHFSDTWQLVINTSTTIVSFLMVFLIQSAQNRKAEALQLKVDELIRAVHPARNALLDLEERTEEELGEIHEEYRKLAEHARPQAGANGKPTPERKRERAAD